MDRTVIAFLCFCSLCVWLMTPCSYGCLAGVSEIFLIPFKGEVIKVRRLLLIGSKETYTVISSPFKMEIYKYTQPNA
jgi:hypothetical protein